MTDNKMIQIEVAYALAEKQKIIVLAVADGTSVYDGAIQSGMDRFFPGLEVAGSKMGVFGKVVAKPAQQVLAEGDRIEIYRPLIIDPKEVRKARAAKVKAEKQQAKAE